MVTWTAAACLQTDISTASSPAHVVQVYGVFGDAFVHGGRPSTGPPPYIDPELLLAEPTADPMVPLDLR